MKKITLQALFLGMLTVLLLSSCKEDEPLILSTADKLEGQWKFEKVKFQKSLSLARTDLTFDYEDFIVAFNDDFSMTQTNATTGQQLQGTWEVDQEWVGFTENSQFMEVLEGALVDPSSGQTQLLDWIYLSVTKNKITAVEYKDGGSYYYTLKKL
jgi:hypothetical protein